MDTSQDQQDDLTANLRKVTLNINSIHLKKKVKGSVWLQSTMENVMEILVKLGVCRNCHCVANVKINAILEYTNKYVLI